MVPHSTLGEVAPRCAGREPVSVADRLDWQIIQELRYDALSGVKELSESLSITPRMIEYRIKKLLGSDMLLSSSYNK